MKEIIEGKRGWLYGGGLSLILAVLLAGVVYKPTESVEDLQATLALHMGVQDFENSSELIDQILARDPENLYATLMQAYIYTRTDEPWKALCFYREALTISGKDHDLRNQILDSASMVALKSGRYEEARHHAERKIAEFGENVTSRFIIALSLFSLNDDKIYEEHLNRAVEMGISDPAFRMKLDTLLGDREILERLYIQSLLDRARYEQRLNKSFGCDPFPF